LRNSVLSRSPLASIVIPTFNGAMRLPRVLAALAEQAARDGSFEVVVVDNASTDDTTAVVQHDPSAQRLRERGVAVEVIAEPRQGLTFARIAGVKAAHSDAVCFLDDDNLPDRDFVANGIDLFGEPSLGLAISRVRPQWEIEPPPSIARRRHLLAVNDYMGESVQDFGATATLAPTIGAGLWIRRSVFLAAVPWDRPESLLPDRVGQRLASGGDIELGILIGGAGFHRIYFPSLRLVHEIPRRRLETAYLCELIEGIVRCELTLREKYGGVPFGLRQRLGASLNLFAALCSIPLIFFGKCDAQREISFVLAARRAHLRGPLQRQE
jgi:glycosyltransferase involved in cell wall biosynthesis